MQIPLRWLPAVRVLLVLAIFLSAGPEIFAAIEMTALLELLGAALFLTAFGAALKLLVIEIARWLWNFLAPPALVEIYRHATGLLMRANVVFYLSGRAVYILLFVAVMAVYPIHLWRMAGG